MGAGLLHPRAFFFLASISRDFCLAILVPSPYAWLGFLWRIRDEGPEGSPLPLKSVTPKQIDGA